MQKPFTRFRGLVSLCLGLVYCHPKARLFALDKGFCSGTMLQRRVTMNDGKGGATISCRLSAAYSAYAQLD